MPRPERHLALARWLAVALVLSLVSTVLASPPAKRPGRIRTAVDVTPVEKQTRISRACAAAGKVLERCRLPARWRKAINHKLSIAAGHCTILADKLERRLPGCLGPAFQRARYVLSPGALASFTGKKFAQDPAFLAGWGLGYGVLHKLEAPAMMLMGVSPALAIGLQEGLEIPINLAVIALRQHALRKDRSQSFVGTLGGLRREYVEHAQARRERNRTFMSDRAANRAGAPTTLRKLGAKLERLGAKLEHLRPTPAGALP